MLLCDSYITFLVGAKVVNLHEVTSDKTLNVQPCVGADLCVRPFSSERNVSCGRTRRSAPTAGYTCHRYTTCFVNNGRTVVSQRYVPSRDARSVRPSPSKVIALAGGMYASLHWVTRLVLSVSFFVSLGLRNINLIEQDRYGDTFFRGVPH